jgi:hypothetical protein
MSMKNVSKAGFSKFYKKNHSLKEMHSFTKASSASYANIFSTLSFRSNQDVIKQAKLFKI